MKTSKLIIGLGAVAVLGACSGSNEGVVPMFDSRVAAANAAVADGSRIAALGLTSPTDIPTMGSAVYEGVILISDDDRGDVNASLAGGLVVEVDFAESGNVTGMAGNLRDIDDTKIDGSLAISDVQFGAGTNGGGFAARLSGQLRGVGPDDSPRDFNYQMLLQQFYYGDDAEAMLGEITGTATPTDRTFPEEVTGLTRVDRR